MIRAGFVYFPSFHFPPTRFPFSISFPFYARDIVVTVPQLTAKLLPKIATGSNCFDLIKKVTPKT